MSFWKDPQYSSMRVLIIVILIAIAGFFVYKYEHVMGGNTGQVVVTPGDFNSCAVYTNGDWTGSGTITSSGCCQLGEDANGNPTSPVCGSASVRIVTGVKMSTAVQQKAVAAPMLKQ